MILVIEDNRPFLQDFLTRLFFVSCLLPAAACLPACSGEEVRTSGAASPSQTAGAGSAEAPLVTLAHWRDSTPNERYAFLIGFITMLELEKEWQGRARPGLLPMEQSLVRPWVDGFAGRPLAEIYSGLGRHLSDHPGDLERPVAEVMWFVFVQPRLDKKTRSPAAAPDHD
jgi:hypothetical protein